MRILFVGQFTGQGGAERSLIPLANALVEAGYPSTIFLVKEPNDRRIFDTALSKLDYPSGSSGANRAISRIRRYFELFKAASRADVVVACSELAVTFMARLVCTLLRRPLISEVQVNLSRSIKDSSHPLYMTLARWIYPHVGIIRAISDGVADDLIRSFGVSPQRIELIRVPIDYARVTKAARRNILSQHEEIFKRPVLLSVGSLIGMKNFRLAIDAYAQFCKVSKVEANLLILGTGPLEQELKSRICELGMQQRIFLGGFVENPHPYFARARGFLLPSNYEGLGRVIVEALMVGCPVISTDCLDGPSEVLDKGNYGCLVPCNDVNTMAAAIKEMMERNGSDDFAARERRILRGREWDTGAVVPLFKKLLDDICSRV